jgi:hypothetical protein
VVAVVRPDGWDFPLFLHVLGAMLLVAGLITGGLGLALARGENRVPRLGYGALLLVSLPGWILMRAGAEWIYDKEGFTGDNDPTWVGIGFLTADIGGIVFLIALVLGGIGIYRLRRGRGVGFLRVSMVLSLVLLLAYVVTIWAMGAKPD